MTHRWTPSLLLAALALASAPLHAAEPIATDRPDVVESSEVVGAGRFQLETSVAAERESRRETGKRRTWTTPTLLRFGLSDTVEARIETDGAVTAHTWDDGNRLTDRGTSDLSLGIKWHVRSPAEGESGPSMAWLFHVDTPTGSAPFRGQGLRPSARLSAEWDFNSWTLGIMPGLYVEHNDDDRRYVGAIFAVTAGKPLTDRLRAFLEVAGQQLTLPKNGGNVVTLDTGLAYLVSDDTQVDIAVAQGLSRSAPRQQWTIGWSMRF